jgi:charged multivesicular body protein 7
LHHTLQTRVNQLSADITACSTKARAALASQNRQSALAALRSRKTAESALGTQLKSLGQVEEVISQIVQAASNIELVNTLEKSSAVLQSLNKEVGGTERVDRIMDGIRSETDKVTEINQILGEGGMEVDEQEVEDELEAMLQDEKTAAERKADTEKLATKLKNLEIGSPTSEHHAQDTREERVPLPAT